MSSLIILRLTCYFFVALSFGIVHCTKMSSFNQFGNTVLVITYLIFIAAAKYEIQDIKNTIIIS
jgi:hypothetical protein